MGRSRLRLEVLLSPKARRRAYQARRKGLEKKARELSILCGVDVCLITYPPPLKNEDIQPFVWSNDPAQVAKLIESYKLSRLGGDCSRTRTYDLACFYEDQKRKIEQEMEKLRKKNREAKYPNWDERYDSLSLGGLKDLTRILTDKIDAAKGRSDLLKERKTKFTEYSNTWANPVSRQNFCSSTLGSMVDRRFEQYPLPYFDAGCYNQEYQRRVLEAMTTNMGASCNVNNAVFNYSENGLININPMSTYSVEAISDQEAQHIGQGLMINNPADYLPKMDAAYNNGEGYSRMAQHIGQAVMANDPADYNFPQMDASFGADYIEFWNF